MKIMACAGLAAGFVLFGLTSISARAAIIPYPNPGTPNPTTYSFYAAATGDVIAYFDGTGASFNETLGLNVNAVSTGITGLQNHSTAVGTSLDLGFSTAGQQLTFVLNVQTTGKTWYSDPSLNVDGANHIYSAAFSATSTIPAGTYVGFEDLDARGTDPYPVDWNYTDEQFIFTNVTSVAPVQPVQPVGPTPVPEPATFALMLGALAALGFARIWASRLFPGVPEAS